MAPKGGIRKRVIPDEAPTAKKPRAPGDFSDVASSSSARPLSRGIRSRVATPDSTTNADLRIEDKPLNTTMKKKWGKGRISAKDVAEVFDAADKQGAVGVPKLSSMNNPQNLHRSLTSAFGHPEGAPEFFWAHIPLKSGKKSLHPFLLPHMWFSTLFAMLPSWWNSAIRGPVNAAQDYWNNVRQTEFFKSHPGLTEDELHRTIPIGMHGDGGAFSHNDSLFVLTWNSLIGSGMTRATRFLITIVPKSEMVPETMPAIMAILVWSFNSMLTRIEPLLTYAGEALKGPFKFLANKYKACLAQLRGDWEFYTMPSFLAFPKWNEVGRMCWRCLAVGDNEDPLKYSRFDKLAPWRPTKQTHEKYLAGRAGLLVPVLFNCIGFRIECIMADVLHCVDLGIATHIAGNIFWLCIRNHVFASNIPGNIPALDALLIKWQKDNKILNRYKGH